MKIFKKLIFIFIAVFIYQQKLLIQDKIFVTFDKDNKQQVIKTLQKSKKEILIAMYMLSDKEVIEELKKAKSRGVILKIILDKSSNFFLNEIKKLNMVKANSSGLFHNKFAIIDDHIVITGSCNWTNNGFKNNHENIIIIEDKKIAEEYKKYFLKIYLKKSFS